MSLKAKSVDREKIVFRPMHVNTDLYEDNAMVKLALIKEFSDATSPELLKTDLIFVGNFFSSPLIEAT
jgi:hypothetical protein